MKRFFSSIIVVFTFIPPSLGQVFNPLLAEMLQDTFETYVGFIPDIHGMSAAVYVPGQGI